MRQRMEPFYDGMSKVYRGSDFGTRYEFDRDGVNVIMWGCIDGSRYVTVENAYEPGDLIGIDEHYTDSCSCFDKLMSSYVPHKYVSRDFYAGLCCKIMAGDLFPERRRRTGGEF